MKTHFIVSVGTSIYENYRIKFGQYISLSNYPLSQKNEVGKVLEDFPWPERFLRNYQQLGSNFRNPEVLGAEETSIKKIFEDKLASNDEANCFHLIATNTKEGLFCASFLGNVVFAKGKICYYVPEGLGKPEDHTFSEIGLPSLLSCLAGILDHVEQDEARAIIVPTGGYKAFIPYLTIASILYRYPAYYIYEKSDHLVRLPAPPLGIDTPAFRWAAVLTDNVVGLSEDEAKPYYDELPESFQKLVHKNKSSGRYEYNAFGLRLRKLYKQTTESPLVHRALGSKLIDRLGDNYKEKFRQMAGAGETIWLGDKALEMADHARHHHINLFAYTELLLPPILQNRPDFLSNEELFLLLGMVYLHDCGHTLCSIKFGDESYPLLATEIRNYHNLLGFHRLRDQAFREALKRQGLDLDAEFLHNVASLSLYHRKKMPLLNGKYTGPDGVIHCALKQKTLTLNSTPIIGDRLVILAALFRIIDGMDKQVARAGDAMEICMKAEAVLADLPHLWARVKRLELAISSIGSDAKTVTDEIYCGIIGAYQNRESVIPVNSAEEPPEKSSWEELKERLKTNGKTEYLPLAWEYLEARTRFYYTAIQPSYYYSDLLLAMPRVTHRDDNGLHCINIKYTDNEDTFGAKERMEKLWKAVQKWICHNVDTKYPEYEKILAKRLEEPQQIVEGIRDEYSSKQNKEVAEILNHGTCKIAICFWYGGQEVGYRK